MLMTQVFMLGSCKKQFVKCYFHQTVHVYVVTMYIFGNLYSKL